IVINNSFSGLSRAAGVALERDGSIVVAGTLQQVSGSSTLSDFEVLRFSSSGFLVSGSGNEFLANGVHLFSTAAGLAVAPDGAFVVAGSSTTVGGPGVGHRDFALARFDDQANLDLGFGGTPLPDGTGNALPGEVLTNFKTTTPLNFDIAQAVLV